jgi:hypothetical protein
VATTENAARFDVGDLPVDVFDLVTDGTAGESLTAGHGMTEYDASRGYLTCNCVASCTVPGCSGGGSCAGSCGGGRPPAPR